MKAKLFQPSCFNGSIFMTEFRFAHCFRTVETHNCEVLCILNIDVSDSRLKGTGLLRAWQLKLASISITATDPAEVSAIVQAHYHVVLGCSQTTASQIKHTVQREQTFIHLCKGECRISQQNKRGLGPRCKAQLLGYSTSEITQNYSHLRKTTFLSCQTLYCARSVCRFGGVFCISLLYI